MLQLLSFVTLILSWYYRMVGSQSIISVYKDRVLMTAQVLSVVALPLSFPNILALVLGFVVMVQLQTVWRSRMQKCGLIANASLAAVVAIFNLALAGAMAAQGDDWCGADEDEECRWEWEVWWAVMLFLSAGLWATVSSLLFVFICTKRYDICREASEPTAATTNNNDDDNNRKPKRNP